MNPTKHRGRHLIALFKEKETEKAPFNHIYDLVDEYVLYRKPGSAPNGHTDLSTDHVFDDTAPDANQRLASSLKGALWPNGGKSIQIGMPSGLQEELGVETEEVKAYYEFVTQQIVDCMDNPKGGFDTALDEHFLAQGTHGISGILVEDNDDYAVPVTYRAIGARNLCVDEGKNGAVNGVWMKREYTLQQLVEEYGFDTLSDKWQKAYMQGDCKTKVWVLQIVRPRYERDPFGFGIKNMPYASIHIDMDTEKILRESGFIDFPAPIARVSKRTGEKYGFSPSMKALPSIFEANAIGEAWPLAVEKTLDPALLVQDDGTMGGGVIDTSPGAINVVSVSGRMGGSNKPIDALFTVGDLQWTAARRTELIEVIKNHYFHNVLFDVEGEQRQTLGEFNTRNQWRGQVLNPVYSRQMSEIFVPVIESTFNKLRRKGLLGVVRGSKQETELLDKGIIPRYIPDAVARRMATGQEVYKIHFISPASRIMQSEELQGYEYTIASATSISAIQPEVVDNVDFDFMIRRIRELSGAGPQAVRAMERVEKIRADRARMQEQMAQIEAARQNSETARNMGQAVTSVAGGEQQGAA